MESKIQTIRVKGLENSGSIFTLGFVPLLRIACLVFALVLGWTGCHTPAPQPMPSTPLADVPTPPPPSWQPATNNLIPTPPPILPVVTNVAPDAPVVKVEPPLNYWVSLDSWCASHGLVLPHPAASNALHTFNLRFTNGLVTFTVGSRVAQWNGIEYWLGFEPRLANGHPQWHAADAGKNLLPLCEPLNWLDKSNAVIVIDPGHGGKNPGARNIASGRYEKEYTLDWGLRLGRLLAGRGWKVVLTRTNDVDLTLEERMAIAEQYHADLFLSLHFNSAFPNQTQKGIETYCLTPRFLPSSLNREFDDNPSQPYPNNTCDARNLQIAAVLHRSLVYRTALEDRGVRRARFIKVLREQVRPAILIEGGYLSNPFEAQRIAEPAHRQKLASLMANALDEIGILASKSKASPALVTAEVPPSNTAPTGQADQSASNTSDISTSSGLPERAAASP